MFHQDTVNPFVQCFFQKDFQNPTSFTPTYLEILPKPFVKPFHARGIITVTRTLYPTPCTDFHKLLSQAQNCVNTYKEAFEQVCGNATDKSAVQKVKQGIESINKVLATERDKLLCSKY